MSYPTATLEAERKAKRLEEAGAQARRAGRHLEDNPYRGAAVRSEAQQWATGWGFADRTIKGEISRARR